MCLPLLEVPALPWPSNVVSSLRIRVAASSSSPLVDSRLLPSALWAGSSPPVAMSVVDGAGLSFLEQCLVCVCLLLARRGPAQCLSVHALFLAPPPLAAAYSPVNYG